MEKSVSENNVDWKMKKILLNLRRKFMELKEKYHPPTNYRRTMNMEPKDWEFREFFFIVLFFFLAFRIMGKVYDNIIKSHNPSYYLNLAIVVMAIFLTLLILYRIMRERNPLIPRYKKPQ